VFGSSTKYSELMRIYPSVFWAEIHEIERCAQYSIDNGKQDIAILTEANITAHSSTKVSSNMLWKSNLMN